MLRVFDNNGKSFDRYTVLIDTDAYGMSDLPTTPQGFNQYIAPADSLNQESLGKELHTWSDLPTAVQRAILSRLEDYIEEPELSR